LQIGQIISIFEDRNGGRSSTFAQSDSKILNRTITRQNCGLNRGFARQSLELHVSFFKSQLKSTKPGKEPQEAQEAQEKGVPLVLLVVPSPVLTIFL
jgi:hypothetical protein